ncbi:putative sugar kinase like protein [Verticillium longisporum]|nr:putative sugar kinase like protein [Verticillium longisporum]
MSGSQCQNPVLMDLLATTCDMPVLIPRYVNAAVFYDLTDALTHLATGNETRSYCSTVCKQGFVPIGVDGSEKGWQEDFLNTIGLGDLTKNNFERLGGADEENGKYLSAGELPGKNKNEKTLLDAKYGVFLEQCRTQQEYRKKVDEALSSWPEAQKA